jgi:hypothetical protein
MGIFIQKIIKIIKNESTSKRIRYKKKDKKLLKACQYGRIQSVLKLIDLGADLDKVGQDSFERACREGHFKIAIALLNNGLNESMRKYGRLTLNEIALIESFELGCLDFANYMISKNEDIPSFNILKSIKSDIFISDIFVEKYNKIYDDWKFYKDIENNLTVNYKTIKKAKI